MITLREYQTEALQAVTEAWHRGIIRQLVCLPTGTGKTVLFAALARELDCRTLIIAHREELINQAVDKTLLVWPKADTGVVMADRDEVDHQVVVASVQTACRPRRLARLREQGFRLLVIDEAHHGTADSYTAVIEGLGFLADEPDRLLVGVTATGKRGDGTALGDVFQEIVFERTIATMIKGGYLADLRGVRVATRTSLAGVSTRAGDFAEGELSSVVNTAERNRIIVESYLQHAVPRKALAFTVDVQHAHDLATEFRNAGVAAAAVWGAMPGEERRDTLEAFANGDLSVVTNCALLTEGYDQPDIGAILMARPTKSGVLYTQMVGRGTRTWPGKDDCLVLDFTDSEATMCSLATLAGVEVRSGETVREALDAAEGQIQEEAMPAGEVVTSSFDLLEQSRFRWTEIAGGHYRLTLGGRRAVFVKNLGAGKYRVALVENGALLKSLSDSDLSLGYAQGVAEDYVRRSGAIRLVDKNAKWRKMPATPAQIKALKRWRITPPKVITRGEAFDQLNEVAAKADAWKSQPATAKQIYALTRMGFRVGPRLTKGEASTMFKQIRSN